MGAWEIVATGSARVSAWDLRIFEMRVKVRESTTCESMARGESVVLKSTCDSASESAREWLGSENL